MSDIKGNPNTEYEDYSTTSKVYTSLRKTVGLDHMCNVSSARQRGESAIGS